ncbi:MAG: DUF1304 family protein [Psychrobium sp.]
MLLYFLSCVIVAVRFSGLTAKRTILNVQGVPALLALVAVIWI